MVPRSLLQVPAPLLVLLVVVELVLVLAFLAFDICTDRSARAAVSKIKHREHRHCNPWTTPACRHREGMMAWMWHRGLKAPPPYSKTAKQHMLDKDLPVVNMHDMNREIERENK